MQGLISPLQHPSFYLQIHLVTLPHSNLFSEYKHNVTAFLNKANQVKTKS